MSPMLVAFKIIETIWNCWAVHMLDLLLLIVKCPFNKIKILWWAASALEKSFQVIYNNTHLNSRETVPLMKQIITIIIISPAA